jgi:hypothetical protein
MKIGLIINHAENPEPAVIPSYPTMRDLAELGELGGLDSIWLFTPPLPFRWRNLRHLGMLDPAQRHGRTNSARLPRL